MLANGRRPRLGGNVTLRGFLSHSPGRVEPAIDWEAEMGTIKVLFWLAIIGIAGGIATMYSGIIDVAATNPHSALTEWVLSTTMDNSVRHHAREIKAPPLDHPAMVMDGFRHYREMCVSCHLAPGMTESELREGLTPEPPRLQEAVEEWTPAELFWVIKNGIKMSGMPAWAPSHTDEQIWAIVAFLEKLPRMTAAQYAEMDKAAGPDEEGEAGDRPHDTHGHDHGAGLNPAG